MKRALLDFFIILLLSLYAGCGIEEYAYLYPIPRERIYSAADSITTVDIPTDNSGTVFTHFIILYRIYMSNFPLPNPSPSDFRDINTILASHHNSIDVYNPSSERNFSSSLLESLFRSRGFKYLCLHNAVIENVLNPAVLGMRLVFDFTFVNRPPRMKIMNGAVQIGPDYILRRSDELINPEPNGFPYFINYDDLRDPNLVTVGVNADVEKNGNIANANTYAAMYIIAVGLEPASYSLVYSNPTLIHAFPLPANSP